MLKTDSKGNGGISGTNRAFLSNNRFCEADDSDFLYPRPLASDTDFVSADLGVDLGVF